MTMTEKNSPALVGRSFMKDEQRAAILAELPAVGRILEIGTGHGTTVAWWARRRPKVTFLSVDIFRAAHGTGPGVIEDWLANHGPNQHLFVGTVEDLLQYGPCVRFDAAFIDGGHSYRDCMTDMEAVEVLLLPGGKMLMHDYGRLDVPVLEGVTKAVDDFCARGNWYVAGVVGVVAVIKRMQHG